MRRYAFVSQIAAFALLAVLTASAGLGADRYWQCGPSVLGAWLDGNNWLGGLPGSSDNAYVDNGGAVSVSAHTAQAWYLYVGYNTGGRIEQSGGELLPREMRLAVKAGSFGHYEMSGGLLRTELIEMGLNGGGTFTQVGGDIVLNGNGALVVGKGPGAASWYSMEGGSLSSKAIYIGGVHGVGQFYHRAGMATVGIEMLVGSGTGSQGYYELMQGAQLGGQRLVVGYYGSGHFVQSGGDATFTGQVAIGDNAGASGTWEMRGGNFNITGLNELSVGYRSPGEFVQTGGVLSIGRGLILGFEAGGDGNCVFRGGTVTAQSMMVGRLGRGRLRVQGGGATISSGGYYKQNAQSELISEVDASGLSVVEISGTAELHGTWTLLDDGAEYGRFDILRAQGGITGGFDDVELPDATWIWGIDEGTTLWARHVPEPATLSLLGLGCLVAIRRKR